MELPELLLRERHLIFAMVSSTVMTARAPRISQELLLQGAQVLPSPRLLRVAHLESHFRVRASASQLEGFRFDNAAQAA